MDKSPFPPIEPGKRYEVKTDWASTGVRSLGYETDTRALDVEYPSQETYRYFEVEPGEFLELLQAPSLGTHVNTRIKPRHPRFIKL
jgi:hypothetical protein